MSLSRRAEVVAASPKVLGQSSMGLLDIMIVKNATPRKSTVSGNRQKTPIPRYKFTNLIRSGDRLSVVSYRKHLLNSL